MRDTKVVAPARAPDPHGRRGAMTGLHHGPGNSRQLSEQAQPGDLRDRPGLLCGEIEVTRAELVGAIRLALQEYFSWPWHGPSLPETGVIEIVSQVLEIVSRQSRAGRP